MNSKRLAAIAPALLAALFFSAVTAVAATVVVLVYPGNLEGWQIQTTPGATPSPSVPPSVNFVTGPGAPPFSRGSAELRVGSDGSAAAALRQPNFAGTTLPPTPTPVPDPTPDDPPPPRVPPSDELTVLGYSTYAQSGGSGGQTPYIILNIDNTNDGTPDDQLFFEPVYQNGSYPTVDPSITIPNQCGNNPACVTPGQWQTWDAFNGGWWSLNAGTFGPPLTTLHFYRSQNPNARIVNTSTGQGGIRVVAGFGAGSWDNFVGNVDGFRIGVGVDPEGDPNVTVYDFEPGIPPPGVITGVIISELRASGPGNAVANNNAPALARRSKAAPARGAGKNAARASSAGPSKDVATPAAPPCCDGDEYIELYNTAETEISVQSVDGSAGWALVQRGPSCLSPPEVIAVIPNGTLIPARGHYLLVGNEYSLGGYPAGPGATAVGDQNLSATLEDDRSIALFNTADPTSFAMETRLDAVGFDAGSGGVCDLLSEGGKLPPPRGSTAEHAYIRRLDGGRPRDTNDNAADFQIVSTTPEVPVGDAPFPRLGAPGPENTTSPVQQNERVKASLIDPMVTFGDEPNTVRKQCLDAEECNEFRSSFGTFSIRRRWTNNTGEALTRLRFRIVNITSFPSDGRADLRAISSGQVTGVVVTGGGTVTLEGTTLEQPPGQPLGGAFNSTLSADTITLATPLAPGASINLQFLLGVQQPGAYSFFVNVEAATSGAPVGSRGTSAQPAKAGLNKGGAAGRP